MVAALSGAGCFDERDRVGPPRLTLSIDADTTFSPDTITGRVRAEDPDGIDSIWLAFAGDTFPADGLLLPVLDRAFALQVAPGVGPGTPLAISLSGRDLRGFSATISDTVRVVPGP
ncbi:MAG: hypothetical protein ACREMV_08715 [Gemmatimonadales bacterium]